MEAVRATICAATDMPDEVRIAEAWLAKWREKLEYCSDDYGCGCCVHLWDVEGPRDAISEIPAQIRVKSDWDPPADSD